MSKGPIVLGIDLGTSCGYALDDDVAGVWNLKPAGHEDGGMRLWKFRKSLTELIEGHAGDHEPSQVDVVAYELIVAGAAKGQAAVVLGELLGVLKLICKDHGISYMGIPVPVVKKHATATVGMTTAKGVLGLGNAPKEVMVAAAKTHWGDKFHGSEDEADARWTREAALVQIQAGGIPASE